MWANNVIRVKYATSRNTVLRQLQGRVSLGNGRCLAGVQFCRITWQPRCCEERLGNSRSQAFQSLLLTDDNPDQKRHRHVPRLNHNQLRSPKTWILDALLTTKNSTNTGESSVLLIDMTIPAPLTEHVLCLPRICYLVSERQEVIVTPKSGHADGVHLQVVTKDRTDLSQ